MMSAGHCRPATRAQSPANADSQCIDPIGILILVAANGYAPELVACGAVSRDPELGSYLVRARRGPYAVTLLHFAAFLGDAERVRALCQLGAQVDSPDAGNCTPLHWCVAGKELRHITTARILLDNGCSLEKRGTFKSSLMTATPLHFAVMLSAVEMLSFLISQGADCNAICAEGDDKTGGRTPLYFAVVKLDYEMCSMLLLHGADINARINAGNGFLQTYLYILAVGSYQELDELKLSERTRIIQLLLDHGADINGASSFKERHTGITPRSRAQRDGSTAVAAFLESRGGLLAVP